MIKDWTKFFVPGKLYKLAPSYRIFHADGGHGFYMFVELIPAGEYQTRDQTRGPVFKLLTANNEFVYHESVPGKDPADIWERGMP